MSNLILVLSAALVALAASEVVEPTGRVLIGAALVFLGLAGAVFSWKFYEYLTRSYERAHQFYLRLDARFPAVGLKMARTDVDAVMAARFPLARRLRVHSIWMILNAVVAALGMLLIVLQGPQFLKVEQAKMPPPVAAHPH